jgi:hypothetical protein
MQGGMTHAKTTYPAVSEPIKLDLPLPARRATLPAPSVRSFPKSFQVTVPEMEAPDSEVVPAEAHAAIKSFQLDAALFPSRLEPEAAHQLSSEADEPR